MKCIAEHRARSKFLLLHMDLHETTDTDNTEFTPARFARDGLTEDKYEEWPLGELWTGFKDQGLGP